MKDILGCYAIGPAKQSYKPGESVLFDINYALMTIENMNPEQYSVSPIFSEQTLIDLRINTRAFRETKLKNDEDIDDFWEVVTFGKRLSENSMKYFNEKNIEVAELEKKIME